MKHVALLLSVLWMSWAGMAKAKPEPVIEFTGRLIDMSLDTPDCGTMMFNSLVVYDQVKGNNLPEKIYVEHSCIELPRSKISTGAGSLERFVIGERHRLQVTKGSKASKGSTIPKSIDPGTMPIYQAKKVDLVIESESSPLSIGGLSLGDPSQFPKQLQDAVTTVGQSIVEPGDFYVQIEPKRTTQELIFHLWHKDAFLPENKNMVGNPGGKSRDVYYCRKDKKVTNTLYWQ